MLKARQEKWMKLNKIKKNEKRKQKTNVKLSVKKHSIFNLFMLSSFCLWRNLSSIYNIYLTIFTTN